MTHRASGQALMWVSDHLNSIRAPGVSIQIINRHTGRVGPAQQDAVRLAQSVASSSHDSASASQVLDRAHKVRCPDQLDIGKIQGTRFFRRNVSLSQSAEYNHLLPYIPESLEE